MTKDTVTLLAGGDIGPTVEPTDQFAQLIAPVMRQADLRFAQCEKTYSARSQHRHCLHPRYAAVWKAAGIDVASVASNHTMEYGGEVLLDTMNMFREMGVQTVGAGQDMAEARRPVIVERNGVTIAFLAYCSVLPDRHEAGKGKPGCAPMRAHTYYDSCKSTALEEYTPGTPPRVITVAYQDDLLALQEDIRKAKQQADAVVMSIHWGIDRIPKAICDYQPAVAHAAIDAGADLILGHHPHCLKAVEVYKGRVCFYSIGNLMKTRGSIEPIPSSDHNMWNLWWYRIDPECMPPNGLYPYPSHCRKTMLAKAVFSRKGVEQVSFLPAFINPQAQPEVLSPSDRRFKDVVDHVEWISDQFPHKLRMAGGEVVVEASCSQRRSTQEEERNG